MVGGAVTATETEKRKSNPCETRKSKSTNRQSSLLSCVNVEEQKASVTDMSESDFVPTEEVDPVNETPELSETPKASSVIAPAEEPPVPTKKARSTKQAESLIQARSTLANKRKQKADLARSDELAHLEAVNMLLQQNIELRQQLNKVPPQEDKMLKQKPPPQPEPHSPVAIQKPRTAAPPRMSARELMRQLGM
jgi:hypothetical protein